MSIFRNAYELHKIGHKLIKNGVPIIPKIFNVLKRMIYPAADIPFKAEIGEGTFFPHKAIGVIIHDDAVIGKYVKIETGVVIGGRNGRGAPAIGDYCFIGTGASILGNVKVGNNCMIGAGAVVITDIPDNTVWGGIPAKYIKDIPNELIDKPKQ